MGGMEPAATTAACPSALAAILPKADTAALCTFTELDFKRRVREATAPSAERNKAWLFGSLDRLFNALAADSCTSCVLLLNS